MDTQHTRNQKESGSKAAGPLLVTGASGHLGRLVLDALLQTTDAKIIATTRHPDSLSSYAKRGVVVRAADFEKPESLLSAFQGAERLLLISTDAVGKRIEQHRNAVEAAAKAGVRHILYTSMAGIEGSPVTFAPEHRETEKAILRSEMGYTILRNNLYADFVIGKLKEAYKAGSIRGSAGEGKTAYVTREDCAKTAAAVLASSNTQNRILEVSGPVAYTQKELAILAGGLTKKSLDYADLAPAALKGGLRGAGIPDSVADMIVSFDVAIKQGCFAAVSGTVKEFTGEEPEDLARFLEEHRGEMV